jgi:hypothetical protein
VDAAAAAAAAAEALRLRYDLGGIRAIRVFRAFRGRY